VVTKQQENSRLIDRAEKHGGDTRGVKGTCGIKSMTSGVFSSKEAIESSGTRAREPLRSPHGHPAIAISKA
jgi:hypothetical protein